MNNGKHYLSRNDQIFKSTVVYFRFRHLSSSACMVDIAVENDFIRARQVPGKLSHLLPGIHQLIFFFGIVKVAIHLTGISNYGPHADELYYIALSKNLAWGYLDISPFVTWIARISSLFPGTDLVKWRILPCLFSAGTVMLTGYITRCFGGGRLAIVIACSAILCSPALLATAYLLQPVVFDEFFWTLFAYAILNFQQSQKQKFLYLAVVALAFGVLNKYTIIIYPASVGIGMALFMPRQLQSWFVRFPGPILLFVLIILPNLIWQWTHGFPVFHYLTIVGKGVFAFDPLDYLFQLFFFHGAGVAVWVAGFCYLFYNREHGNQFVIWPVSLCIVMMGLALLKGKLYYALGIFPVFFAAGGTCWALMLKQSKVVFRIVFVLMLYVFALLSFPLVIPVLPMPVCRIYIAKMVSLTGFSRPMRWEDGTQGSIPQFFADMSGWKSTCLKVFSFGRSKSDMHKNNIILTDNYAIAGALMQYNPSGSWKVISVNNSFLLDSPANLPAQTILYLSKDPLPVVGKLADHVELKETIQMENSHLNGIHIYLLGKPNALMQQKYKDARQRFFPAGNP